MTRAALAFSQPWMTCPCPSLKPIGSLRSKLLSNFLPATRYTALVPLPPNTLPVHSMHDGNHHDLSMYGRDGTCWI